WSSTARDGCGSGVSTDWVSVTFLLVIDASSLIRSYTERLTVPHLPCKEGIREVCGTGPSLYMFASPSTDVAPENTESKLNDSVNDGETVAEIQDLADELIDNGGASNMAAKEIYEALVKYTGGVKTVGLCAGGGGGFVVGGNASTCLIVTQLPNGEFVLDRTESVGVDFPTIGGSAEINLLASNADNPSNLHGHGIDFGASAAWGVGANVGIEFGYGAENSKGKQVWAAYGGIQYGAEAEISIGYNFTGGGGMIKDAIGDLFS
ncbi:hypothetical protein KBZ10_23175, partial [Streptomyces sp. F63]|uniref:hypothetical protein n=1 Tax=Streptomyces sp. F63 TaxID=2824887 RepID=UPI001B359D33